uniref:Centromere protein N n=1 Tax=Geotrypetes seraphini TaxID=260995 RepID=A0A6P8QME0_GEOSA|nr:centromere protein N [Geotrypetes seraphini]XP_033797055.1 centromere protein N [Geotrypetes seraphini]XP_033797056.1 centromere protein N [Geotrypetes seraphini]
MMDDALAEFIKRTVMKIPLHKMQVVLRAWGFLTEGELQKLNLQQSKENIIMDVLHLCEGKQMTLKHAAILDITYNHIFREKRNWSVYQMVKPLDYQMELFDMAEFKSQFKRNLKSTFQNISIHFKELDGAVWIRIAWGTHYKKPQQYKPTFVVYHSQTSYVFICNLSKLCRPALCQAIVIAAQHNEIQEMELRGHSLDSLKDIVFKQYNRSFQTYLPRPLQERNVVSEIVDPRVIYENKQEKERIWTLNRETFGDRPQPKLEFAQYKLDTMFRGDLQAGILAGREEPFRCVVRFSSPHLLEGLRSLAPSGFAEAPLSQLLTCIPHKARNLFRIGEKRN